MISSNGSAANQEKPAENEMSDCTRFGTVTTGSSRVSRVVLIVTRSSAGASGGSTGNAWKYVKRSVVALRKATACAESAPVPPEGGAVPGVVTTKFGFGGACATAA